MSYYVLASDKQSRVAFANNDARVPGSNFINVRGAKLDSANSSRRRKWADEALAKLGEF